MTFASDRTGSCTLPIPHGSRAETTVASGASTSRQVRRSCSSRFSGGENGIAFGPEDDAVYVGSSFGRPAILRFPLTPSGLGKPETVVEMESGHPDGLR